MPVPHSPELPANYHILQWRDPDSNRGHHDFQSRAGRFWSLPTVAEPAQIRRIAALGVALHFTSLPRVSVKTSVKRHPHPRVARYLARPAVCTLAEPSEARSPPPTSTQLGGPHRAPSLSPLLLCPLFIGRRIRGTSSPPRRPSRHFSTPADISALTRGTDFGRKPPVLLQAHLV